MNWAMPWLIFGLIALDLVLVYTGHVGPDLAITVLWTVLELARVLVAVSTSKP